MSRSRINDIEHQATPDPLMPFRVLELDIYDCFQEADMAREMMFKPLQLVDLGQESEAELATHGEADMLELLLKQSQQETFVDWVEQSPDLLQTLFERDYWESGLR